MAADEEIPVHSQVLKAFGGDLFTMVSGSNSSESHRMRTRTHIHMH